MPRTTATITTKGQVTIPAAVRRDLAVHAGDRLEFIAIESGKYMIVPKARDSKGRDVRELKGMFGKPKKVLSIEEMNMVIAARGAAAR